MAGRKDKNVVDYFPHYCLSGKTLFILESKYGNDGYAVWYKILEQLGTSDNHFIDCRDLVTWTYLQAKMKIDIERLESILTTLSEIDAIHPELWENRIIWSSNFVKNISDVYIRRKTKCMNFQELCSSLKIECKHKYDLNGIYVNINSSEVPSLHTEIYVNGISDDINSQSKVKESKVEESIKKKDTNVSQKEVDNPNVNYVVTKSWREDYQVYLNECKANFNELMNDRSFILMQEKLNPGVDVNMTLQKAFLNFWSTEAGWHHKRKKKIKEIDWRHTITNAINPMNKVKKV